MSEQGPTHVLRRFSFERGDTIAAAWIKYCEIVYQMKPEEMHPGQQRACSQAFYGAAAWVLGLLMEVTSEGVSEDGGVDLLDNLHKELLAYNAENARLVHDGHAGNLQ